MATLPEVTSLFAKLASNLESGDTAAINDSQTDDLAIASLNQSLNLSEHSRVRVRVLDTALSLMCFTAPQVFDSMIEYSVEAIVAILSSSINLRVLRVGKEEAPLIGGSISSRDCGEVIKACADVLGKLKGHGTLFSLLLYAVVRVSALATSFRCAFPFSPILDVKSFDGRKMASSKLLCHLPQQVSLKSQELPLRLLFWYLNPMALKQDVSGILQDSVKRPFLCVRMEFYERMEWRSIVLCLVLSPAMFIETRSLLQNWFLATGLASVLELQIELTSLILDIISRPMWWGISAEVGAKLPFSHGYFLHKHQILRILAGPLSHDTFLQLVHFISCLVPHAGKHSDATSKLTAIRIATVDHKSVWAMAMSFPDWFYFASMLLFFGKSFFSKYSSGVAENEQSYAEQSCSAAAARYVAWMMNPTSDSHQDTLADCLIKISGMLAANSLKEASGGKRKLKKTKHRKEENTSLKGYNCQSIGLWLEEFQHMYIKYETGISHGLSTRYNMLFRRIPLGILIGCTDHIDNDGCDMLLHYAATGKLFASPETHKTDAKHRRLNSERQDGPISWSEKYNRKEAVAGARLVFDLTDVSESISGSLFDSEESGVEFVCRVQSRAIKFLIKCVYSLVELENTLDDRILMLNDLHNRLVRWKHQGQDVFHSYKDIDDAICAVSNELSSL